MKLFTSKSAIKIIAFVINIFSCVSEVETTAGFISELNQKWINSDITGIKNTINERLSLKGNQDLTGLIAKCDYYALFEYNEVTLLATALQVKQVMNTLNWDADKQVFGILNATIQAYENPQQAQAKGYLFALTTQQIQALRADYPNQYPSSQLLLRFANIQYP